MLQTAMRTILLIGLIALASPLAGCVTYQETYSEPVARIGAMPGSKMSTPAPLLHPGN